MYTILIEKSAQKSLLKIPKTDQEKVILTIQDLKENPRPLNSKKLKGREGWRVRVGNYRIIYEIIDTRLVIDVISVGHRKDIYRQK